MHQVTNLESGSDNPERYNGFKNKYLDELKDKEELIKQLRSIEKIHHTITLLYSAKDEEHNNAVVLLELLKNPEKSYKVFQELLDLR